MRTWSSARGVGRADAYRQFRMVTAFQGFQGRSPHSLEQDGWEEVANYTLAWANDVSATPASAARSTVWSFPAVAN